MDKFVLPLLNIGMRENCILCLNVEMEIIITIIEWQSTNSEKVKIVRELLALLGNAFIIIFIFIAVDVYFVFMHSVLLHLKCNFHQID
jgi:hypothetical protein